MSDKQFPKGFLFKRNEKAPEYIIGQLSIKVEDAIAYLEEKKSESGYVNIDVKLSKGGTYYMELNTWKPTKDRANEEQSNQSKLNNEPIDYPQGENEDPEQIPF